MASGALTDFLRRLRGVYAGHNLGERTDAELLEQFVACQEESAFEALVQRHGPMVLGVCRHLLGNTPDAEDAFQATFLVLVSKAASIRQRTLLANWLYRVAYRVAVRARMNGARRRIRETAGGALATAQSQVEPTDPELRPLLHEELNRLPEKYRLPILLCYLQGKAHEEAARQLAWPIGTVKGRLARARELLRGRLTRRGLALSSVALLAILTPEATAALVPAALLHSTLKAACLIAAGQAAVAGMVSAQAAALSQGVLRTMFWTRLTMACTVLLGVGALGVGAGLLAYAKPTEPPVQPVAERPPISKEESQEKKEAQEKAEKSARQISANHLHELMTAMHNYLDVNGHFPPAAIYDKKGKALLSWRVLLLPYLEKDDLFKQFHLDEPWDSKHNKPLLAKMPKQYAPPLHGKTKVENGTFYQVFVGKGTVFEGAEGIAIADITDGTSLTIAIVEAAEAVPWTKPADLPYDAKKPLPKLGGLFAKGFHAAFADGSVKWLKKDFDQTQMRIAITRNDAEVLDLSKLQAEQ
jgi:RNA polymerase sigma factor (sigma-70 family)